MKMHKSKEHEKEHRADGGHVHGHHKPKKHKLEHHSHSGEHEHHRARGGHVDGEGPDEPLKKGGVAKKKHSHHDHGGMAKSRLDKRARGGKIVTPKSPLSGAAPTKERPGFSEKQAIGKENN